jgi:hypothetical protein
VTTLPSTCFRGLGETFSKRKYGSLWRNCQLDHCDHCGHRNGILRRGLLPGWAERPSCLAWRKPIVLGGKGARLLGPSAIFDELFFGCYLGGLAVECMAAEASTGRSVRFGRRPARLMPIAGSGPGQDNWL